MRANELFVLLSSIKAIYHEEGGQSLATRQHDLDRSRATGALAGRRVLVTRARDQAGPLLDALRAAGAVPVLFPTIEIAPATDYRALDAALASLEEYGWLLFTSANTVTYVELRLWTIGSDWQAVGRGDVRVAAVGARTADLLSARGVAVAYVPTAHTAVALAEGLPVRLGERVLLPGSEIADDAPATTLRARGAHVDTHVAYRTIAPDVMTGLEALCGSQASIHERGATAEDAGVPAITLSEAQSIHYRPGSAWRLLRCPPVPPVLGPMRGRAGRAGSAASATRSQVQSPTNDSDISGKDGEGSSLDAVTLASPSAVRNLVAALGGDTAPARLGQAVVACIGPSTAQAAREVGLRPRIVASDHTSEGLVRALEGYFATMTTDTDESTLDERDTAGAPPDTQNLEQTPGMHGTQRIAVSQRLFAEAREYIPGGVDSPVRAFKAVGGTPRFIERGEGAYLYDADGNRYTDYVLSYGPLIAGHAPAPLVQAIKDAAARGTSYGAPTRLETELARRVRRAFPHMELTRFVSSGTEATMSALRIARAYTRRDIIIKVEGGYHGHSDGLLARAGSAAMTLGVPDSPGVPAAVAATTVNIPFNDLDALERALRTFDVAAFILEPIPANMGVVPPAPGYLEGARALTEQYGALLVFDEIISGFRVAFGGAQQLYGVEPDMTCLGKIIGGGLPVGAYGGRRDIMSLVAPLGPVYQAGTLSGNPLAMTAGITLLDMLAEPGVYERLDGRSAALHAGLLASARRHGVPTYGTRVGSIGTLFFASAPVTDYTGARASDIAAYARFFNGMIERGVYLAPAQFEAIFVSLAHSDEDIRATIQAADEVFATLGAS